jgi:hypothetical protein
VCSTHNQIIQAIAVDIKNGISVSSAGDVNGDGLDDLIVGATHADLSGKKDVGKSYVVFGKADSSAISKPSPLTSPALETERPLQSFVSSPLITKPPGELLAAIVLRLMGLLSALPNI